MRWNGQKRVSLSPWSSKIGAKDSDPELFWRALLEDSE